MGVQSLRRTRALNTAASVAIIIAAAAVLTNSGLDLYSRLYPPQQITAKTPQMAPKQAPRPSFRAGMRAPVVSGVKYGDSERTLVLFLSIRCTYCEKSVPFYRELATKLAGLDSSAKGKLRMVAVFPQSKEDVEEFKASQKLRVETVVGAAMGQLGVSGTPTVLLVSREGTVLRGWVGAPAKETQETITAAFITG